MRGAAFSHTILHRNIYTFFWGFGQTSFIPQPFAGNFRL